MLAVKRVTVLFTGNVQYIEYILEYMMDVFYSTFVVSFLMHYTELLLCSA